MTENSNLISPGIEAATETRFLHNPIFARLSAMMFLQHLVLGAFLPIFSHYLKNTLQFPSSHIGLLMGLPAASALVAPAFAGQIADRFLSAERMLALCHFLSGFVMLALSYQTRFEPFLVLYLAWSLLYVPTSALSNTVAFHHVPRPREDFPRVRVWGTVGWVVVAWMFSLIWLRGPAAAADPARLADAFRLSAVASWVLGLYSLTLPRPDHAGPPPPFAPWKAIRLFLKPSLLVLCLATFFNSIVHQFYYFGMGPYLSHAGFSDSALMPVMSVGQMSEVAVMGAMAFFSARMGMKWLLVSGIVIQAFRYALFAFVPTAPSILLGISTHGFCYTFFFITAYVYVDLQSGASERARAQQLYNIVVSGLGNLAGFVAAGRVAQVFADAGGGIDYRAFWSVPALLALVLGLAVALFFREERTTA